MDKVKPVQGNGPHDQPPPYSPHGQGAAPYPPGPSWQQSQPIHPAPAPIQGATVIVQQAPNPGTQVVVVGGCPTCRAGVLEDDFGCCAIFLAIFFFPIGLLCCMAMVEKRCTNCRARF